MEYLEDTQYFYEGALPYDVPLGAENSSNENFNEYSAEVGDKSNNHSSPPVHVDIP